MSKLNDMVKPPFPIKRVGSKTYIWIKPIKKWLTFEEASEFFGVITEGDDDNV